MQNRLKNPITLLLNFLQKREITESEQYYQQIQQNSETFIPAIVQKVYSFEDETKKQSFIWNLHARLVWEMDYFTEIIEQNAKKSSTEDIRNLNDNQKSVLLILENLYAFTLDNFAEYCDRKQKLPAKSQPAFTRKISEKFKTLSFAGNEPDSVLFGKVKTSIKNKLKGNQCRITYGLTVYLERLFREIEKIGAINKEYSHSISLSDILIAFNFNSLAVVHYLVSTIIEDVKKVEPVKEKIERLNLWFKQVNQVPVNSAYSFNESREGVRQYLNKWIQEEISFYEKSLLLFSGAYPAGIQEGKRGGFKIETELAVTQIACFVRLFMDCGIFKKSNIREIISFLAEHIRSKKQENISAESFRLKYYNIEESTRESVRNLLFQMLEKSAHPF